MLNKVGRAFVNLPHTEKLLTKITNKRQQLWVCAFAGGMFGLWRFAKYLESLHVTKPYELETEHSFCYHSAQSKTH